MKKIVIIDGQGGKIGAQLIDAIRERCEDAEIVAVGTNSIATSNMLRSGPDAAATGENPVIVACRDADVIAGPIGIVIADALYGEVTPAMALAVGQSRADRVLIPVNKCGSVVVGVGDVPMAALIREAADCIADKVKK
ncbi:MAG: DUF3842 family protein [Clostridia bacterium]|nr:DUF3842 family protein [Clostridia bacterium]